MDWDSKTVGRHPALLTWKSIDSKELLSFRQSITKSHKQQLPVHKNFPKEVNKASITIINNKTKDVFHWLFQYNRKRHQVATEYLH